MPRITDLTAVTKFKPEGTTAASHVVVVPDWAAGIVLQATTGSVRFTWNGDVDPSATVGCLIDTNTGPIILKGQTVTNTLKVIDGGSGSVLEYGYVAL